MSSGDLVSIGKGLALLPSGCCILTATAEGRSTGMLASWVQQAAFEPPMVSVAIKRGRPIEQLIQRSSRFVLNLVGDDPKPLFRHFGRGFELDQDAFAGLASRATEFGVELDDAAGVLSCVVTHVTAAGDHNLYLAGVAEARVMDGTRPYVHLRKNGMSY